MKLLLTAAIVCAACSAVLHAGASKVAIESDGGYSGIVVRIADRVPEENCPLILANIKKLFDEASHALYDAMSRDAYFNSVSVVVPSAWRDSMCRTVIREPKGNLPYRDEDILITAEDHPLHGGAPFTQQSKGCGKPGDLISIPASFLAGPGGLNRTWARYGDPAKILVHEWSKYRYGIFDDTGFPGDPLYPEYFLPSPGGELRPTGDSNVPVEGLWVSTKTARPGCDPRREKCIFRPFMRVNEAVNCSLGFMHFLPGVTGFCREDVEPSPTVQRVMCQGRSAIEIIRGHDDFAARYRLEENSNPLLKLKPTFRVMRSPRPKFILVLETSASMDSHDQWRWIVKAAGKFVRYDAPDDAKIAVVTFGGGSGGSGNSSAIKHPLAELTDKTARGRLADSVPDKYHLASEEESSNSTPCLLCGIQKAVDDVLGNGEMGGAHLVVVTRGQKEALSFSEEETIQEYVKYYHVRLSTIIVPSDDSEPLAFYDSIARASGGISRLVSKVRQRTIETYMDLLDAFSALLEVDEDSNNKTPRKIHQNVVETSGFASTSGRFVVDSSLGRDTTFGVYVADEDDHLIKSVTFTRESGDKDEVYGPFTSMSSEFDVINLKVVNFRVGSEPPFDRSDLLDTPWRYTVEWFPAPSSQYQEHQRAAIVVTSRPGAGSRAAADVSVSVWTNSAAPSDIVTDHQPLALFARVTIGGAPVVDAKVEARVLVTAGPNGTVDSQLIRLLDNGNGDPDMTAGDGIYSRYMTSYHTAGRYEFIITATDNNRRAYKVLAPRQSRAVLQTEQHSQYVAVKVEDDSEPPSEALNRCCGSRTPPLTDESLRRATGAFMRQRRGPVIHLLSVPNGLRDNFPPARIPDLRLEQLERKAALLATWTAPGDDYNGGGAVSGYRFVVAHNASGLLIPTRPRYETLAEFSRTGEASGTQTSYQLAFPYLDKDLYVAMKAFDDNGNEGKISNLVLVRINSSQVDGADNERLQQTPIPGSATAVAAAQDDGVMIGILCGTFVVIACMLWAGIYYLRNHRGGRGSASGSSTNKNSGVNATLVGGVGSGDGGHDTSSSDLDVKSLSRLHNNNANSILPQFSSIAAGGPIGSYGRKDQSIVDDSSTPTYWSASQLLNEHEQRQLNDVGNLYTTASATTYHNNHPPPLDPIVEDPEDTYGISEMYNRHHLRQPPGGANMTSTPIKYANLTFPRRQQSVSPSSDSLLPPPLHNGLNNAVNGDLLYGYAQSEPPNGLYGTLSGRSSRGGSGRRTPPRIPPKPSLGALLGLNENNINGTSAHFSDDTQQNKRRSDSSENLGAGLTVRNVSQV